MNAREATLNDLESLLELAEAMHAESRYAKRYPFNVEIVAKMLRMAMAEPAWCLWVVERDDQVIAAFMGAVTSQWFSSAKVAQDLALFVRKEDRGSMIGPALIARFARWAKEQGAVDVEIGVNTGISTERTGRLLQARGFNPVGHLYSKEL